MLFLLLLFKKGILNWSHIHSCITRKVHINSLFAVAIEWGATTAMVTIWIAILANGNSSHVTSRNQGTTTITKTVSTTATKWIAVTIKPDRPWNWCALKKPVNGGQLNPTADRRTATGPLKSVIVPHPTDWADLVASWSPLWSILLWQITPGNLLMEGATTKGTRSTTTWLDLPHYLGNQRKRSKEVSKFFESTVWLMLYAQSNIFQ